MASESHWNVLVVDRDEECNVETKSLLSAAGHTAEVLSDPDQAVAVAAQGTFQVALVDVTSPESAGAELIEKLRSSDSSLRVLGMTSLPDTLASTGFGPDFDTLRKPLDLDELAAALRSPIIDEIPPTPATSRLRTLAVEAKHRLMDFPPSRRAVRALCRTGLVPEAVWGRLPVEQRFRVPFAPDVSFLYESPEGDDIGQVLYLFGAERYEFETTSVFARLARKAQVVLDIGANTGLFSLIACAANPNSRVIAFEPVDRVRELLTENVTINGWSSRCEIRPEAVSDTLDEVVFHVPHAAVPSSARLESAFRGHSGDTVVAKQVTIDSLELRRVDLVKIDVEGFEDRALAGMEETISRWAPDFIVECNSDGSYEAIDALMREAGYSFHHLRKDGVVPVDHIVPDESGRARNFLLSRRPRSALFD